MLFQYKGKNANAKTHYEGKVKVINSIDIIGRINLAGAGTGIHR